MAAIYCPPWPKDLEVTTTLYPVDMVDSVAFDISLTAGSLALLPLSDFQSTFGMENGTYTQLRWFISDGIYDSDMQATFGMEDGSYTQLRWFLTDGPYDSDLQATFGMLDGTIINKLVIVDTPDELLQLNLVINVTCSMDLI